MSIMASCICVIPRPPGHSHCYHRSSVAGHLNKAVQSQCTFSGTAKAAPASEPSTGDTSMAPDQPAATPPPPSEAPSENDLASSSEEALSTSCSSDATGSTSESESPAPPPRKKSKRSSPGTQNPAKLRQPPVDFLKLRRAPLRSTQPPPPRRLKLPTLAPDTLRRLRNRTKVVDVDEVLHPRPFGGRANADGPPQRTNVVHEYLRGVGIIVAYRCYFFPTLSVQWAMYAVWLQGHAAGLSISALRALDGQGRTHLAQYPGEYHSPAELTEAAQGLLMAAAPRAPPLRSPPSASVGGRPPLPAGRPETCIRWNAGRCANGQLCRRAHICLDCGGAHQARTCRNQPGNGPRPLVPVPRAGRY